MDSQPANSNDLKSAEVSAFIYPSDAIVVDRLETDPRMQEAAEILERHVLTPEKMTEILQAVVDAKGKAERFGRANEWLRGWKREAEAVDSAIETLMDYFRPFADAPEGSQLRREMQQLGEGLAWARQFAANIHTDKKLALSADMPHSRKRDDPTLAFCKILCGELQDRLGQPLCNFVAITVAVVFGVPRRMTTKAVEDAWEVERNNR